MHYAEISAGFGWCKTNNVGRLQSQNRRHAPRMRRSAPRFFRGAADPTPPITKTLMTEVDKSQPNRWRQTWFIQPILRGGTQA